MSVTVTQELTQQTVTVTGNPVENNVTVTVSNARGPAGTGGGGSATWGSITGTLSAQTDLQTALNLKAPLASPALTGTPTAPTATTTTNTTQVATTAFVQQELASGVAVAKNLEVYVRNMTGASMPAGTIVYINGANGNRPTITKAQANSDANSAQTFGFAKTALADGGFGFVIVRGELENVNTNGLGAGTQLYLSPSDAGNWTTTKPSAPNHLVYVGIVVKDHPTQGIILVAIQNGYELSEIHDVSITAPVAAKQVIKRNAGNTLWINSAIVSADVSDATSAATPSALVLRDGSGDAAFAGATFSGLLDAGDFTANGATGQVTFGSASQILFDGISYTYGTGAAAAHRTALGGGATGDALFVAATPAAARTTLGIISRVTTADVFATSTTPVAIPELTFPVEANKLYKIDFGFAMQSWAASGYQVTMNHPNLSRTGNGYSQILHSLNVKLVTLGATSTLLNRDTAGNPNGTMGMTGYAYIRPTASGNVTFTTSHQSAGSTLSIGPLAGSGVLVTQL